MQRGDHLISPRSGYSHHGLYLGKDKVIHYTGFSSGRHQGKIAITTIDEFSQGYPCTIKTHLHPIYSKEEGIARAYRRLGEDWYDVLLNNCEHFVNWCIDGMHSSDQINNLIKTAAITKTIIASHKTAEQAQQLHAAATAINHIIKPKSTGLIVGAATGSAISTSNVATTAVAGLTAFSSAPLAVTVAAGAAVGYGVMKLVDWLWD